MYVSTRGQMPPVSFSRAVLMGLATDGGLLLPRVLPEVASELAAWRTLPYPKLAAEVMLPFVGTDLPADELRALVERSYAAFTHPDTIPVRRIGPVHIMELFHGPTLAFKDVALQFLGHVFEHILARTGDELNILGATSGDTGSAAIAGVRGKRNIRIFIMHPRGRTSPVQERQMTSVLDPNVHNIAILGTFDDGQRVLKQIFNDIPFKTRYRLGAVNSVNWARVLAQIVYYFHGAFRVQDATGCGAVQVCVPTGNFGDVFAGYLALRMGAPISRLILATNENDILARFFNTGVYQRGTVQPTTSPSMDIQVASNFERYLYYRLNWDSDALRQLMQTFARNGRIEMPGRDGDFAAGSATEEETLTAIRTYYRQYQYLPDPHTAVGLAVAERFLHEDEPTLCLATAHPAKFGETIARAVGKDVARHPAIDALQALPTRCKTLPASQAAVKAFIRDALE